MADRRKNNWRGDEEGKAPKGGGFRRFLVFLLVLLAVLAVVLIASWRDGTGFDAIHRWLNYGGEEKAVVYDYDADRSNRFALLGDGLVVASTTGVRGLDGTGTQIYSATDYLTAPAVSAGATMAAVVDPGGTKVSVLTERGLAYELTAEQGYPFLAATVNSSDWLAVTSQAKNYKGRVSVYDPEGGLVFAFHSSERFVIDACVSADNQYLAAVTLGQENGVFRSEIILYPLNSEEPSGSWRVKDGLVIRLRDTEDGFAAVSDTSAVFADTKGKITGSYDFAGRHLREYSLDGDGYAALLLNRYKSGSTGDLVTVASDGTVLGQLSIRDEIRSLSAAGRYVAVLYADELVLYTPDLLEYARLEDAESVRAVLMREDGSAMLLESEQAEIYLP